MKFTLVPILDRMEALYQMPRTRKRFEAYLQMLQGENEGELLLPIGGYNPMATEQVLAKLSELQALDAEALITTELSRINPTLLKTEGPEIAVVLNLADDRGGAWSHFSTTDFANKFAIGALVKRNFCTPYFWTGESYTEGLIRQRTRESVFRTVHWLKYGKPQNLAEHVAQETFVWRMAGIAPIEKAPKSDPEVEKFFGDHADSTAYHLIFNFFYGDKAALELGYPTYGCRKQQGFVFAQSRM